MELILQPYSFPEVSVASNNTLTLAATVPKLEPVIVNVEYKTGEPLAGETAVMVGHAVQIYVNNDDVML
jgi:hypothetical protein